MPLYDYVCQSCRHQFEAFVRKDVVPQRCPRCEATTLERLPSLFAVNSDATRHASLTKARKANLSVERDKAIANEEYINKHHD